MGWSAVAALFADTLGTGRDDGAPAALAAPSDDPCALRQPLATGSDARCVFELARAGAAPLVVDLDQRWNGNVLVQWLNVRPAGSADSLHFVYAQTAGPAPARLQRVFPVRAAGGDDHLAYLIGRCGATTCGISDLVVVGDDGGKLRVLLSARLGALAEVQRRDGGLTTLEAWSPPGATAPLGMVARRFAFAGSSYALRDLTMLPAPSPSPSPR